VKSNAIVLAKGEMVVGVGAGQMSRVDSVHMAVRKAGERSKASALASDAFFPFRDNVDEAARAGVTAIVQPGGSMRDAESIAACDEHGLAMIFTGVRHFRHYPAAGARRSVNAVISGRTLKRTCIRWPSARLMYSRRPSPRSNSPAV